MKYLMWIPAALLALSASASAEVPMPALQTRNGVTQMLVDGKPYLMLAGELHNSSASNAEYMKPIWDKLSALKLNTVVGTVSWELVEPEEGHYDFALVDDQIRQARRHNMRLVLIWFATWKNGVSTYVPMWVKTNPTRFPRMKAVTKPNLTPIYGTDLEVLSAHGEATLEADSKAFRALMKHIREVDPQHTVIMMQVENESGLLGDSRDRSAIAEAAWAKPVPAELLSYLQKHKDTLLPETKEVWGANGFKTAGTWGEVFGTSVWADEAFMAYHVGRYIGKVAEAGKAELAIPMYANAWLGPQPRMEQPGLWPSGGPVARVMDFYRAAAPALDLFAPDIYVNDFKGTCALYARSGNPLFIPEARALTGNLFWALSAHAGLGFSPFGIERLPADHQLREAYSVLGEMAPIILKAQAEKKIAGFLLEEEAPAKVSLGGYDLEITALTRRAYAVAAGEQAPAAAKPEGPGPGVPVETRPYGLVISSGPDEFIVVGSRMLIRFTPQTPGPRRASIGTLDEGRYEQGIWIAGRRLNGDEGRVTLSAGGPGVLKVKLYRHE